MTPTTQEPRARYPHMNFLRLNARTSSPLNSNHLPPLCSQELKLNLFRAQQFDK